VQTPTVQCYIYLLLKVNEVFLHYLVKVD